MASAADRPSGVAPALATLPVIDAIPAIAWSSQPDGSVEFVNRRWRDYTGLSPEESYGWGWKTAVHVEDLAGLLNAWGAGDVQEERECQVRLRCSDGVFHWFLVRRAPLHDETGALVRWFGTGIHIEDGKQKELLRVAEKRALEMIADGASLSEVLKQLCAAIDEHTLAISLVMLMDRGGDQLLPFPGPHLPPEVTAAFTPWPIGPNMGSCGTAAFTRKRVIISDISKDPRWPRDDRGLAARRLVLDQGLRAAWSEPLISNGEVLGTFCITYSRPRTPNGRDLELIEAAGHIARIAIERQRSQESLRSALETIRNSETRFRQVIDAIPTLAWCNLPDGPNEFLNKRWHEYTGLSHEQSNGWGWQVAFHPEDVPPLMEKWRELLVSGEPGEMEARLRRRDGVYRWFLIRVEPFRDENGKLVRWYGTSTDIEDRKQAEEKLRQDERELRQLIDFLPQHVLVLDAEGTLVQANQTTLDYSGHTLDEMRDAGTRERIKRDLHPDDADRVANERRNGISKGVPFEIEKRVLGRDGQFRWFLFRYKPVLNEDGRIIRWFATATDIDDRKQAEYRMSNENLALREEMDRSSMFEDVVGSSEALRKVLRQVDKVAASDSTVLILGETGTGKELIARAIHKRSRRAERAFIGVNCAAIPPSLIASELFGHEKGAFTGATQRRMGRFESANGGTIFLDEVGDLPAEIQIALLRVLQEREIERVGSSRPIPVDVRVVAATHRDLNALVAEGKFRQDLLYRLNVVPIQMPPLRERVADIPLLVEYFIDRFGKRAGKKFRTIDKKSSKVFQAYGWPGNVRELQNVIERAVILSEGETLAVDETWLRRELPASPKRRSTLTSTLVKQEKEMIEAALAASQGRISGPSGAATKLGLLSRTLDSKIRRLKINVYRFKTPR